MESSESEPVHDPAVGNPEKAVPGGWGTVECQVRADVAALVSGHPMGEALAEMSFALARVLDEGPAMMSAAVNRELRLNLLELARLAVDGDDDFEAGLSAPVFDSEDGESPDVGSGGG